MVSPERAQAGAVMRAAREGLGLTQKQVADKLGISQRFYAKIEKGTTPGLEYRQAIAAVLGLQQAETQMPSAVREQGPAYSAAPAWAVELLEEVRALRQEVAALRPKEHTQDDLHAAEIAAISKDVPRR